MPPKKKAEEATADDKQEDAAAETTETAKGTAPSARAKNPAPHRKPLKSKKPEPGQVKICVLRRCLIGGETAYPDDEFTVANRDGNYLVAIKKAELIERGEKEGGRAGRSRGLNTDNSGGLVE